MNKIGRAPYLEPGEVGVIAAVARHAAGGVAAPQLQVPCSMRQRLPGGPAAGGQATRQRGRFRHLMRSL